MKDKIALLGFSGSVISLLFSTLNEISYINEVAIIENIEVNDLVPFECNIPYKRVWYDQFIYSSDTSYLLAMMNPGVKLKIFDFYLNNFNVTRDQYINLVHPSLIKAKNCILDNGIYIEPGCILSPYSAIGFGVSINRGCTIGHHTSIDNFATIGPGVNIAGHCKVGAGVSLGIGTTVFDHISIGNNSQIGGGSVVTKDIPENVIAYGNPCKIIKPIHNEPS